MASVGIGCLAAAIALGAGTVALGAGPKKPPARDSFSGSISAATNKYKGDHGHVSIYIAASNSAKTTRRITLTLSGRSCGHDHRCLALDAKLSGTLTRLPPTLPDIGSSETLKAGGDVKPLGHSSVRGTVHGTGMLGSGRESISLTLVAKGGKLTLSALSGVVPGFTSP